MAYENLNCPSCGCPLTAPLSELQTQLNCPRCSAWLELEKRCKGVCLSCHAGKKAENTGSCADTSSIPLQRFEQAAPDKQKAKIKEASSGLRALFKRVFHV